MTEGTAAGEHLSTRVTPVARDGRTARETTSRVIADVEVPAASDMLAEVVAGLGATPKTLPSKYFYDQRGSELFERITELPEYYPTRTERALLARVAPEWLGALAPRTIVELGAGSASKTRLLLDAALARHARVTYVPVDVSADFLDDTARALRAEYPALDVRPAAGDFTRHVPVPDDVPSPALWAFLGSTIGNFDAPEAARLLAGVAERMTGRDRLLLGVDLRKDVAVLEPAYDDAQGVTAEFNRNVLHVVNRELGADFDADAFAHRAFYDRARHRIEMHLVAERPMRVRIPGGGTFTFAAGESVRTEISCKYDRASVAALFDAAGLALAGWATDDRGWFALALAAPAGA